MKQLNGISSLILFNQNTRTFNLYYINKQSIHQVTNNIYNKNVLNKFTK